MSYEQVVKDAEDRMRLRREHPELVLESDGAKIARAIREQTRELQKLLKPLVRDIDQIAFLLQVAASKDETEEEQA